MSQRTLPLLFFNLGGEMLYILHQRLHAQNVVTDKTTKVMQEMVETMFREQWLEEMFQPQPIFSRNRLLVLLLRVAHSSIMRLNNIAMEKLYDLISMAFKYQLMACPRSEDVVMVTFNHLDSLKSLVAGSQHCLEMIHTASRKLNEHYGSLSKAEFITLRSAMLSLLQDSHKRISVLMRQKFQHHNGKFVMPIGGPIPVGFEIPGTVRYYSEEGEVTETDHFPTVHHYSPPLKQGSWEAVGDRVTTLGLNIYHKDTTVRSKQRSVSEGVLEGTGTRRRRSQEPASSGPQEVTDKETQGYVAEAVVNVELSLLRSLLVQPQTERGPTFKLCLFPDLELDDDCCFHDDKNDSESPVGKEVTTSDSKGRGNVLHLETHKKGRDDLDKIREEFTVTNTGSTTDDDLLDLLDMAVA